MDPDRAGSKPSRRAAGRSAPPARLTIEVILPSGLRAPGLARWLQTVAPVRARGLLTVAVVPDVRVRALNRKYRQKDENTDVLSFPHEGPGPGVGRTYLGDVVIAAGVARRHALRAKHSLQTELRILALHGLLHLLGYDHEHDAGEMARVERRLRRKGGLREGLIERSGEPSVRPRAAASRR
jgi:probable rRNA maturation factor